MNLKSSLIFLKLENGRDSGIGERYNYIIVRLYLSSLPGSFVKLGKIQARDSFSMVSEFSRSLSRVLSVRERETRKGACQDWMA